MSFRDTLGTAAFQEGLSNGMPVEKRTVEEAIAKAKSRQAKVRRLIHGDDDTKPPEPVPHEPQYDVVPLEIEADDLSVLLILNQTQGPAKGLPSALVRILVYRCFLSSLTPSIPTLTQVETLTPRRP